MFEIVQLTARMSRSVSAWSAPTRLLLLLELLMPWQVLSPHSRESLHFHSLCWLPCSKASAYNALFTLVMSHREFISAVTLFLSLFLTGKQIQEHLSFVFKVSKRCGFQCLSGGAGIFLFAHTHYIFFFFFCLFLKERRKRNRTLKDLQGVNSRSVKKN